MIDYDMRKEFVSDLNYSRGEPCGFDEALDIQEAVVEEARRFIITRNLAKPDADGELPEDIVEAFRKSVVYVPGHWELQ